MKRLQAYLSKNVERFLLTKNGKCCIIKLNFEKVPYFCTVENLSNFKFKFKGI